MSTHRRSKDRTAGFTLAEVLAVVVILGVLAAVAIPRFTNQEGRANLAAARSDARAIALNIESMLTDATVDTAGDLEYNTGTGKIDIIADGGLLQASAETRLTPGSTLPAQSGGNGNNRISSAGDYCIAVTNNGQTAYFTRQGLVTSCLADSEQVTSGDSGGFGGATTVVITKTFLRPAATDPAANWAAIAYGARKYVAAGTLGETPYLAVSPNGLGGTWTLTAPFPDAAAVTGLAFGQEKFVAIGSDLLYYASDPASPTWTKAAATFPTSGKTWALTYGAGRFVAVADGYYLTSTDAVTWDSGSIGAPVSKVAYAGGKFLAIAPGTQTAYTSADGATWTAAPTLPSPGAGAWVNVTAANGIFYITGNNTTTANVIMSANASAWDAPQIPPTALTIWAFATGGAGATYLIPASATTAVKSVDSGSTWSLHGLVQSKAWTAGASDSAGVVTLVGLDGWTMSST